MAEAGACSQFQAHAWRKGICANCLRGRDIHKEMTTESKEGVKSSKVASSPDVTEKVGQPRSSHNAGAKNKRPNGVTLDHKMNVQQNKGHGNSKSNSTTSLGQDSSSVKQSNVPTKTPANPGITEKPALAQKPKPGKPDTFSTKPDQANNPKPVIPKPTKPVLDKPKVDQPKSGSVAPVKPKRDKIQPNVSTPEKPKTDKNAGPESPTLDNSKMDKNKLKSVTVDKPKVVSVKPKPQIKSKAGISNPDGSKLDGSKVNDNDLHKSNLDSKEDILTSKVSKVDKPLQDKPTKPRPPVVSFNKIAVNQTSVEKYDADIKTNHSPDRVSPSGSKDISKSTGPVTVKRTRSLNKPAIRPKVPPPKAPGQNLDCVKEQNQNEPKVHIKGLTNDSSKPKAEESNNNGLDVEIRFDDESENQKTDGIVEGGHYYHKYDVTGSLGQKLSKPASKSKERVKRDMALTPPYRIVDLMNKPIVAPYTVVDVTAHQRDCEKSPPKLPDTPPPERERGDSLGSNRSLGSEPGSREGTWKSSKKTGGSSGSLADTDGLDPPTLPVILQEEAARMRRESKSPPPIRKVPIMIPPKRTTSKGNAYEPVEDPLEDETKRGNKAQTSGNLDSDARFSDYSQTDVGCLSFARHSKARTSAAKSNAVESKMAALASVDLLKGIAGKVPLSSDSTADVAVSHQPDYGHNKQTEIKDTKVKKGGKYFFKKLLRIGSKETSPVSGPSIMETSTDDLVLRPSEQSPSSLSLEDINSSSHEGSPLRQAPSGEPEYITEIQNQLSNRRTDMSVSSSTQPDICRELRVSEENSDSRSNITVVDNTSPGSLSPTEMTYVNSYVTGRSKKNVNVSLQPVSPTYEAKINNIQQAKDMAQSLGIYKQARKPKPEKSIVESTNLHVNSNPSGPAVKPKPQRVDPYPVSDINQPSTSSAQVKDQSPGQEPHIEENQSTSNLVSPGKQQTTKPSPGLNVTIPSKPSPKPPAVSPKPIIQNKSILFQKKDTILENTMETTPSTTDSSFPVGNPAVVTYSPGVSTNVMTSSIDGATSDYSQFTKSPPGRSTGPMLTVDTGVLPGSPDIVKSKRDSIVSPASSESGSYSKDGPSEASSPQPLSPSSEVPPARKRRRSKKSDNRPGHIARSMMPAPPPPPPHALSPCHSPIANSPDTTPLGSGGSSPDHKPLNKRPNALGHADISGPLVFGADKMTRSLSSPDEKVFEEVGHPSHRRVDSVTKHSRNKTVTEGIRIDFNPTSPDKYEADEQCSTLDRRTSKFLNRALPPTPKEAKKSPGASKISIIQTPLIQENEYELVSLDGEAEERGRGTTSVERPPYEDIDISADEADDDDDRIYHDPLDLEDEDAIADRMMAEGQPSEGSGSLRRHHSDDYLEPISGNGDDENPTPGPRVVDKRCTIPKARPPNPDQPYLTVYANSDMVVHRQQPALCIEDGFTQMGIRNVETLSAKTQNILARFVPEKQEFMEDLRWKNFILRKNIPVMEVGDVAFYEVRNTKVKPYDCFLMICRSGLSRSVLEWKHCSSVTPVAMFCDRISSDFFPRESASPSHYHMSHNTETNIAVLSYSTIMSLDAWVRELNFVFASDLTEYERRVCVWIIQVTEAVLDLSDKWPYLDTIKLEQVLAVTLPIGGQSLPILVIPGMLQGTVDHTNTTKIPRTRPKTNWKNLSKDITRIFFKMLRLDFKENCKDLSSLIPTRTKYSNGFKKFVKQIVNMEEGGPSMLSVISGKFLLETMLWGPNGEDLKPLLVSEDKEQSFQVWLEMQRCSAVNYLALGPHHNTLEFANKLWFLCSVIGKTLSDCAEILNK